MSKLTSIAVKNAKRVGMFADGNGLYLKVQLASDGKTLNKSWILRWGAQGRNTMGLGSAKHVTLADARAIAFNYKRMLAHGTDPRAERERSRAESRAAEANSVPFARAASEYIKTQKAGWRNGKHAAQWQSTLETYAFPVIGSMPCAVISKDHIIKVLDPIWTTKHETASRLRGRMERVFEYAIVKGYRVDGNPAQLRGVLRPLLPVMNKRALVHNHKAMSYASIPEFIAGIKDDPSIAARALLFCILTATRTTETTEAKWHEIDLERKIWTIPRERMKRSIEHRVPISDQLLELLGELAERGREGYLFVGRRKDKAISNMTMLKYLQRKEGCGKLTVHGFRSAFRDWAGEKNHYPREVCEQALAHGLKDPTEAAYQRGDYLEKRITLMQVWADYCFSGK